jgi:hypothetical protein
MNEAELRGLADRVLVEGLPRSLREALRDAVRRGGTKRAIMGRAKARAASASPKPCGVATRRGAGVFGVSPALIPGSGLPPPLGLRAGGPGGPAPQPARKGAR